MNKDKKSSEKNENKKSVSYTDRADGYGTAGAESEHNEQPYEKEREANKKQQGVSSTKDDYGMPNQQGEMDQYTFRDHD